MKSKRGKLIQKISLFMTMVLLIGATPAVPVSAEPIEDNGYLGDTTQMLCFREIENILTIKATALLIAKG